MTAATVFVSYRMLELARRGVAARCDPANQRLIDTFLPDLWASRATSPVTEVSLSDAVDLALRDHAPT